MRNTRKSAVIGTRIEAGRFKASMSALEHGVLYIRVYFVRAFALLLIGLFRIMPERAVYAVAIVLGRIAWFAFPRWWRVSLRNIRQFYQCGPLGQPEARRQRVLLARQSVVHLAQFAAEFIRLGVLPQETALRMVVETEGLEHYAAALQLGRGVIGLAMHLGNWELSGAYLNWHGIPLRAVGKPQRDDFFTRLAFPWRERYGMQVISSGEKLNSAVLRALKDNCVLGLLADQNGGQTGVFAPFAGTMVSNVSGPAVLALKYGAPLLVTYCVRLAPGRLKLVVHPPLDVSSMPGHDPASGKYTPESVVELLTRINAAYEAVIRQHPEQWLWIHTRYKTRPPGEPRFY
jgi:Kdo2-lipid IVA lauroyltransferase/acyltransferase